MKETKIQYVLKHKGLFEALIVLRINGHEQMFFLYIRKGTNLQKYARKFNSYDEASAVLFEMFGEDRGYSERIRIEKVQKRLRG